MPTRLSVIPLLLVIMTLPCCIVLPLPHATLRSPKITGRTLNARTLKPVAGASVRLANLPGKATTTGTDGRFTFDRTHLYHLLWYANPSFSMSIPYADIHNYWSGELLISGDGYEPTTLKAATLDQVPWASTPVTTEDVYLLPAR